MSGRYKTLKTYHDFPHGERWLRRQAVEYTKDTAKQKRIALERFDAFLFLSDYFDSVDSVDNLALKEFAVWLDDSVGHAHSTLRKRWYAVREYLNEHVDPDVGWLEDDDWILEWTRDGTETAYQLDLDIHWLPQDKIEQLIDGAAQHPMTPLRNKLVVELLYNTGCRPSEIARMKTRRMNRDKRQITVKNSKVQDTDADNYEKEVYYSRKTRKTMREWLDRGGRNALFGANDDPPYLIVGYNSPGISARQVNSIVRQAADAADIQEDSLERADGVDINRVTPKALRHSFAVHSVRGRELSGSPPMNLETLRRIMGHGTMETTREYLKFRDNTDRAAFDQTFPR